MAIQRRAILYQVTTPIAAAALQAWHTTPIEIAPAPGASRIIQPMAFVAQYKAGTAPFSPPDPDNTGTDMLISLDATFAAKSPMIPGTSGALGWITQTTSQVLTWTDFRYFAAGTPPGYVAQATIVNKPLLLRGSDDLVGGAIATTTLNAAGLGYAANDTGTIVQDSATAATYIVNTVGALGVVTAYTITAAGFGYVVANGLATTASGGGTGFKVNITGITKGNGALYATVFYGIVPLS